MLNIYDLQNYEIRKIRYILRMKKIRKIRILDLWFSPSPTLLTARVSGHPHARRFSYQKLALNSASVCSLFLDL